jgi:hypothetical protein
MRLAEAHAGVDVERVEHHRLAAARQRHLFRGGMRQRVRAPDDETLEGQPQIKRRAAERVVSGGDRGINGAKLADVEPPDPQIAMGLHDLGRFDLGRRGADHGAAHG